MEAREEENKNKFREDMTQLSSLIGPRVELIKRAKGKDENRIGLYNSAIIFNNKISEILHYYYEREVPFFDDSYVSNAIYDYLSNYFHASIFCLDDYMEKYVIAVDGYAIVRNNTSSSLVKYKDYTDQMYNFDLKKDIPKALDGFLTVNLALLPEYRYMFLSSAKIIMDDVKESLEKLGLQDSYKACEEVIDKAAKKCVCDIYENDIKQQTKGTSKVKDNK